MPHAGFSNDVSHRLGSRVSRRDLLRRCGALSFTFGWDRGWPHGITRVPTVRVAPQTVVRDGCTAVVTVQVTIAPAAPGHRYAVQGELWEGDDPDGDPDFAGALEPLATPPLPAGPSAVVLRGRFLAAALGLEKGVGPASDEAYSPDLAEIYARVTLRDLTREMDYGPWDSPVRVAVAQETRDWTGTGHSSGGGLTLPRGGRGAATPPRACTA